MAGQGRGILPVSCGARHFNFYFFKVFLIHPNSKMTAKNNFYRQAGTHICCGFTVNDFISESRILNFVSPRK